MTRPEKLSEIAALIGQPDAERWYADRTDRQLDQLLTSLRGERGEQRQGRLLHGFRRQGIRIVLRVFVHCGLFRLAADRKWPCILRLDADKASVETTVLPHGDTHD